MCFFYLLVFVTVLAPKPLAAFAGNEALRGQTSMSVYVNVDGNSEINAAEFRLALEEQLLEIGVNVLPHAKPPNYPVLLLTIDVKTSSNIETITQRDPTRPAGQQQQTKSITVVTLPYSLTIELRRLAPGTNAATRPIRDEAFWKKTGGGEVVQLRAWTIGDQALQLASDFVDAWVAVNPRRPATTFKPAPPAVPREAAQSVGVFYHETVQSIFPGAIDSIQDVPESQRALVQKQLDGLRNAGQKVVICEYRPHDTSKPSSKVYAFWYQAPPADMMKLLTTTFSNPFVRLGKVAVNGCPKTVEAAEEIYASRLN